MKNNNFEVKSGGRGEKIINTRRAYVIAGVIILAALLFSLKGFFIAATVNGSPISRLAVINELEKQSGKQILDSLITEKLIKDEARKKGISVDGDEIDLIIKEITDQVVSQGETLEQFLTNQNVTQDELENRIMIQQELEKLLSDKIKVSEEEISKYIKDNEIIIPEGQETEYNNQITTQIQQQKLNTEAGNLISSLKSQAKINYFVNY